MKHISRILWGVIVALAGLCPSVASAQEAVTLPFSSDFTTQTGWTLLNEEGKNVWVIGEDAKILNAEGKTLFLSPDGSIFGYNSVCPLKSTASVAHAYVKINVQAGQPLILTFRYYISGEAGNAGVYVGLLANAPENGKITENEYSVSYKNTIGYNTAKNQWQEAVIEIAASSEAGERYLVFTWFNNSDFAPTSGGGKFAAIDDVELRVNDCPAPSVLTVQTTTAHAITYAWTAGEGIADLSNYTYQIQKKAGTGAWGDVTPVPAKDATAYTLSDLTENTAYGFRIRGYRSESSYSPWVTAPVTTTPYACPAPTGLAVKTNADGDYMFTWQSAEVSKYILEYRRADAADWTATAELTAATYTLPAANLPSATAYEARVRGVCAATDLPNYTKTISFKTPCGIENLPFVETFDTWETDGSLSCWTMLDANSDNQKWGQKEAYESARSGSCAKCNYPSASVADDWLVTPALHISGISELSFWFKTSSFDETFSVEISTTDLQPESFSELCPKETLKQTAWVQKKIILDETYAGKTIYLAIHVTTPKGGWGSLYIDDFSVKPYPAPTLSVSDITTNSATLTLASPVSSYSVRYRVAGTETWTTLDNQASPLTLPNLISGTTYEVQAQAHYAGGHDSEWSDLKTFNTCVELPYIQDFSTVAAGQIPTGWTQIQSVSTTPSSWAVVVGEDGNYLSFDKGSGYSHLVLPTLLLGNNIDRDRLELSFSYSQDAFLKSYFNVSSSTDGGLTWQTLTGSTKPLGELDYGGERKTATLVLKEIVGDASTLMIRFEGTSNSSLTSLSLYDVRVQEHRCLPPVNLHVDTEAESLTPTTAELVWSKPEELALTGYNLTYALTEAGLETAEAEALPADALAKTLSGLLPNHTAYYVRMTSVCGEFGEGDPATLSFHTLYTCPKIDDLHLTKLTDVSATLAFTYATEGVTYEAAYKTAAAADWTSAPVSAATSFELTALQPDTRYLARVRVVCAADDQSLWDTLAFKTPAGTQALPLKEGFEGTFTENAPEGWQYECLSGAAATPQVEQVKGERAFRYAGEASLRHPGNTGGTSLLVSPYLALQADLYYRLSFALRLEGYETARTDSLGIWFNTAPTLTGARKIAVLKNHGDTDDYKADLVDGALGKWKPMLFDSLTDLESGYLLLHIQGDAEQNQPFYIDELSLSRIYATNLELQAVVPMPARANMGAETVAVVLNNTGEQAFVGEVQLSYQVNERPAVSETLTFTAENPLASQTPYTYTFAAKADLSVKGSYTVKATLASDEDPLPDDNAAELTTESYEALALPFETDFSPASAGAAYIQTWNADHDDYEWILPPAQPQAMIYGRNSGHLDDYLYTPGLNLPAGKYEVRITYAARQATYVERLSVGAYARFTAKEAALPILTDTTSATAQKTAEGLLEIAEDGIYMLGIHAESDSSRGINVYSLSIKAKEEPVVKPVINIALFDTICDGETYRFGERELTEAGRYFDTIRAAEADTARELTLAVLLKPVPPVISRQDEGKTVTLVAETPEAQVQWYEADEMIFGAEEKRFTVTYDGVYHATAIGVCGESEASNKIKVENLAVEGGLSADAPVVYPNPARTAVRVRTVTPIQQWRLLSAGGVEVAGESGLHATDITLSVHAVKSGVYVLYIATEGGNYTCKLQVLH